MRLSIIFSLCVVALSCTARRPLLADDKADAAKELAHAKQTIAKAVISLSTAIEIAQKAFPRGHVVEAELHTEGKQVLAYIELIVGIKHTEVTIDAVTSKMLGSEVAEEDDVEAKLEQAAAKSKISPLEAIEAALKKRPTAKALWCGPEISDGKLVYEVDLLDANKLHVLQVDIESGQVLETDTN